MGGAAKTQPVATPQIPMMPTMVQPQPSLQPQQNLQPQHQQLQEQTPVQTPSIPLMNVPNPNQQTEGRSPTPSQDPTPRLQSNMFKLQRNRSMFIFVPLFYNESTNIKQFSALKKSYVDVFNPSGAAVTKPPETIMAPALPSGPTPQSGFFVPGQPTGAQSNGQDVSCLN